MAWISLILAGCFEIVWATAMKQSHGFSRLWPSVVTICGMIVSFALLSWSMRSLPLGTAYTIWTGIGAMGVAVLGILRQALDVDKGRGLYVLAALVVGLVVLVAAIIPACRLFEGRWMGISDEAAAGPALRGAYRRDQALLWLLAIGLPFALTALFKLIASLG